MYIQYMHRSTSVLNQKQREYHISSSQILVRYRSPILTTGQKIDRQIDTNIFMYLYPSIPEIPTPKPTQNMACHKIRPRYPYLSARPTWLPTEQKATGTWSTALLVLVGEQRHPEVARSGWVAGEEGDCWVTVARLEWLVWRRLTLSVSAAEYFHNVHTWP